MGTVFRAIDEALGREVAIKVLQEKFTADSGTARCFADEARITAQLQHPAIPPVHDFGTLANGRPFLAMKLIKGSTLDLLLAGRHEPSQERGRFVAVFEQVCQAVAYAHAHAVIHRDLKPANVMVGAFGEVQVMDWGLAKVLTNREGEQADDDPESTRLAMTEVVSLRDAFTQAGSVLGTPAFMSPEQAIGAVVKVDARSDVFGLGAILAVILTGQPPFVAGSGETTRVKAAQGKLDECFSRLDACGAEPDLVALCKNCLAPEKDKRPADAGEIARAVAQLRAAADERARRAELERVRVEGEQAATQARIAERRKRRRLAITAAALLTVAIVGGLTAVLIVQRRANTELAQEQAKVQARFELAQKAIETFHTGVSEEALLKNAQFNELRTKLLKQAAGFYADLEKLLAGQTDPRSRKALASAYFQLGQLTDKIGSKAEAVAVHRKALGLRRELAAAEGADLETQLDVPRSLGVIGEELRAIGDNAGALAAWEEQRNLTEELEAENPTSAVQAVLAMCLDSMGRVYLQAMGKPEDALMGYRKALSIHQKLVDANPTATDLQLLLAGTQSNIGVALELRRKVRGGGGRMVQVVGHLPETGRRQPHRTAISACPGQDQG